MASRTGGTTKEWTNGIARRKITFRFLAVTGASPTTIYDPGDVVNTITWVSTGLYTITLRDAYKRCLNAKATLQTSAATALFPQFGDFSNEGTSTAFSCSFRTINGSGTVTDMTTNANNSISIELEFEDSSGLL